MFDAVAVLVVFVVPLQRSGALDRSGHQPGATSAAATAPCKIGQLDIVYYGESGAAGTSIVGFKVTDSSKNACDLSGYPTVEFFTGTTSAPRPLAVNVSHEGPGIAFAAHPRPIVVGPSATATSADKQAAFVFTSADFASDGSDNCPLVSSIVVRLPQTGQGTRVFLWYPSLVCRSPASASVSSFFPASSLDSYTLPDLSPPCTTSDLRVIAGGGEAGLGHVGLLILFRNVSVIPCRMRYYPSVALLDASGRRVATAKDTPSGYLGGLPAGTTVPPLVSLTPGQVASALVEGEDRTSRGAACPAYPTILVSPPVLGRAVRIERAFYSCDLEVHPVVPGATGSFAQPAATVRSGSS